ncbi:hypothetical protein, partial [Salmonella enterica]|uniref:hypothetical protein n=1 Tax=Salmonella enterica TaxID=28901 RepID=UPI00329A43B8
GKYTFSVSGDSDPEAVTVYTSNTAGEKTSGIIVPDENGIYEFEYRDETAGEEVIIEDKVDTIEAEIDISPFLSS